jgi:hypothetical protein
MSVIILQYNRVIEVLNQNIANQIGIVNKLGILSGS